MKKSLLVESSVIEDPRQTGVGYFTTSLVQALEKIGPDKLAIQYLWLNFLGNKRPISRLIQAAASTKRLTQIRLLPQRVYAKLVFARIAPPLLVPSTDWVLFPNFYVWPLLSKAKRAVIIHDICYMIHPEYVEEKNRAFLERVATRSINSADLIISNSAFTTSELQRLCHIPSNRIVTIDIPVESSLFIRENAKSASYMRKRYGIEKPYILTLGTIEPRKNIEMLLDAYCRLPQKIRGRYSLVIAGKWGWKIDALRQKISHLQEQGYDIITPGYIEGDDKSSFYFNASYFVITSHYEGFGMPLLEALYCGLPTAAVNIPVLREVGGTSCLWAEKNVEDISRQLAKLISSPRLSEQLAKAAALHARTFSWERSASAVYDRLCKQAGNGKTIL